MHHSSAMRFSFAVLNILLMGTVNVSMCISTSYAEDATGVYAATTSAQVTPAAQDLAAPQLDALGNVREVGGAILVVRAQRAREVRQQLAPVIEAVGMLQGALRRYHAEYEPSRSKFAVSEGLGEASRAEAETETSEAALADRRAVSLDAARVALNELRERRQSVANTQSLRALPFATDLSELSDDNEFAVRAGVLEKVEADILIALDSQPSARSDWPPYADTLNDLIKRLEISTPPQLIKIPKRIFIVQEVDSVVRP